MHLLNLWIHLCFAVSTVVVMPTSCFSLPFYSLSAPLLSPDSPTSLQEVTTLDEWLDMVKLGRYRRSFYDHGIKDLETLAHITPRCDFSSSELFQNERCLAWFFAKLLNMFFCSICVDISTAQRVCCFKSSITCSDLERLGIASAAHLTRLQGGLDTLRRHLGSSLLASSEVAKGTRNSNTLRPLSRDPAAESSPQQNFTLPSQRQTPKAGDNAQRDVSVAIVWGEPNVVVKKSQRWNTGSYLVVKELFLKMKLFIGISEDAGGMLVSSLKDLCRNNFFLFVERLNSGEVFKVI